MLHKGQRFDALKVIDLSEAFQHIHREKKFPKLVIALVNLQDITFFLQQNIHF